MCHSCAVRARRRRAARRTPAGVAAPGCVALVLRRGRGRRGIRGRGAGCSAGRRRSPHRRRRSVAGVPVTPRHPDERRTTPAGSASAPRLERTPRTRRRTSPTRSMPATLSVAGSAVAWTTTALASPPYAPGSIRTPAGIEPSSSRGDGGLREQGVRLGAAGAARHHDHRAGRLAQQAPGRSRRSSLATRGRPR